MVGRIAAGEICGPKEGTEVIHPIEDIQWIDVGRLGANDWNPNHVFGPEMKLLELSILRSGWIQPVLVSPKFSGCENDPFDQQYTIIDGFHRSTLARTSKAVHSLTAGKVPCAVLDIDEAERMLLTVRINRAKGSHTALKMHELVRRLVEDLGIEPAYVAQSIGAGLDEVKLLLREGVFKALDIDNHQYSQAWVPK